MLLAVDSSAKTASVALAAPYTILAEFSMTIGLKHSQTLLPIIQSLFQYTGIHKEEIDGIAVAIGPGSFTGLRIGIAAAKGMAQGLDKPCIPVSTLTGLAHNLSDAEGILCAAMDARCNQVYNALFEVKNQTITRLCADRALSIGSLLDELKEKYSKKTIFLVGDGAKLCYNKGKTILPLKLAHPQSLLQRASSVGLAALSMGEQSFIDSKRLVPSYLRLSQAERNLLQAK